MRFVLDCSVAISWCMPDETNNEAEVILDLLARNSEAVDNRLAQAARQCNVLLENPAIET
jgi:hypothetical protein